MSFVINKQITIATIVLIFLIWVAAVLMINAEYENKCGDYLAYRDEIFDNAIDGVVRTYESFSNFIFLSAIDNDLIKGYLFEANHGDESVQAQMRKKLAEELNATHRLITSYNFRQFHFQLASGDSFYRFHSPDKFGDNLLDVRQSMRIANLERKYVSGFEEGRIFSGYRFVYPLNYKEEHVGSIEISISPQCILEEMYALDPHRDLGFILSKDVMKETVFGDQQSRYQTSFISEEYVSDVEISELTDQRQDSLKLHQNPLFLAKLKGLVEDDLHQKNAVSLSMTFGKKAYLIQYRLIHDISNRPVGYFYGLKEDSQIQAILAAKKILIILATMIMLILMFLVIYTYIGQQELRRLAITDQLTNIYNRHSFYLLAGQEIARAERSEESVSIAMIDIDYFKRINDSYGHAAGDEVIKTVVALIKDSIREADILARYGGEEFIVLMPATTLQNACTVAERIRKVVGGHRFKQVGHVTVSAGLAERIKKENIDTTIERADKALYEAKETGRNRTCTQGLLST